MTNSEDRQDMHVPPLPDVDELSRRLYEGLTIDQVDALVPVEAMAMCHMNDEGRERIQSVFKQVGSFRRESHPVLRCYGAEYGTLWHRGWMVQDAGRFHVESRTPATHVPSRRTWQLVK